MPLREARKHGRCHPHTVSVRGRIALAELLANHGHLDEAMSELRGAAVLKGHEPRARAAGVDVLTLAPGPVRTEGAGAAEGIDADYIGL